jgi:putative serine protease PepD
MASPRHLWTGEWRSESDRARAEEAARLEAHQRAERTSQPVAGAPDADRAPRGGSGGPSRRVSVVLGLMLAIVAIAAAAFAAGTLIDGGASNGPAPLAAVSSAPIKPHKGETQAAAIFAAASPAVVSIRTSRGSGTGFLIEKKGTIVTNDHVVDGATHVSVQFGQAGQTLDGDVIGTDPSSDLAVVSISPDQVPKGVAPLRFADSRAVKVGDTAVAIGNPLGLDRTATEGIVSGLGRSIQSPNGYQIDEVIQTDAPINPGNSGGPLLDDGANVIGINSQIATAGSQGNIGIGFAVPSNTVRQIVPKLEKGETIKRPYLGVRTSPTSVTGASNGAQVVDVTSNSPAERGGIKVGDTIRRVQGHDIQQPSDVAAAIVNDQPGDKVDVQVTRNGGQSTTLHVTLGTRPRTP